MSRPPLPVGSIVPPAVHHHHGVRIAEKQAQDAIALAQQINRQAEVLAADNAALRDRATTLAARFLARAAALEASAAKLPSREEEHARTMAAAFREAAEMVREMGE